MLRCLLDLYIFIHSEKQAQHRDDMACNSTFDVKCGFRSQKQIAFQNNFLKDVKPSPASHFRSVLLEKQSRNRLLEKNIKKFLSSKNKNNFKNVLKSRRNLSATQHIIEKKSGELNSYKTYALLAFSRFR